MQESATAAEPGQQRVEVEGGQAPQGRNAGAPVEKAARAVTCAYCGESMVRGKLPRFQRGFGIVVLIMGLVLSTFALLLIGLPLVVIGAYMAVASRSVWTCRECGAVVDRHGT